MTEEVANLNFDVDDVLAERQHEAAIAFSQKEYFFDQIRFVVNVLVDGDVAVLKQWTNPTEEVLVLRGQVRALHILLIVQIHVDLHPEFERQLLYKLPGLRHGFLVVIKLNLSQNLDVQIGRYLVLPQNSVEDLGLLLVLGVRFVGAGNDRRQGTGSEREKDNADELKKDAEDSFVY